MKMRLLFAMLAALAVAPGAQARTQFYRLQSAVSFPGPVAGWDYLAFDAARSYLFMDRRALGVTVYDVKAHRVVGSISDSQGANSTTLVPALDRGFTSNGDGSTTIFRLSTLKTIARVRFGKSADAGFYEPVTGQMVFAMGDDRAVAFVDARTGKAVATLRMDAEKLEAAVPDGHGNLFMNERDRDRVARIDARRHLVTAEWPTTGCHQPTAMAYDARDGRIFSGCRGDRPVLAVLDAASGEVVAAPAIGRGVDTVVYDAATRRIYASCGLDANIVVIGQKGPDRYVLEQAVSTRPEARTMALDPATQALYLVTAEGIVDPSRPVDRAVAPFYPNAYVPNSFTLLTYALK